MKNNCSKPSYQLQYLRTQKTGFRIWPAYRPELLGISAGRGLCKITLLCCLFLLPDYSNAQVKQTPDKYELLLKSASVIPEENLQDFINEPDIKAGEKFEGRYFKFIQFYEIPNQDDREEIESMGIRLLNYIPNNTYAASIPENFDPGLLQKLNVRSVISIEADYKIDNRLKTLPYPDWALYGDNSIDIVVQYYKNIDPAKVKNLLIERGSNIISAYDYSNLVTIRVNISEIESIASLPFVSWVEPIASPPVKDDTKGRTLHRTNWDKKTEDLVKVFIEEEYLAFPVGTHDDLLDALARICEPNMDLVFPKEESLYVPPPTPSLDKDIAWMGH
ncbi:MAG: hypothetical protein IIA88_02450 [Bacteroidetes bacterium]|nr:hypothetical protein [Bacteroidota bacterium]